MSWIKENWFKVTFLLLLAVLGVFYYKINYISQSELYKINSDCAERATNFAKSIETDYLSSQVTQSKFVKQDGSCYAEFGHYNFATKSSLDEIYDLTHNKLVERLPDSGKEDPIIFGQLVARYSKIRTEIFGVDKKYEK